MNSRKGHLEGKVAVKLHHVGIVVKNIESFGPRFTEAFGFQSLSPIMNDPVQKVSVQFWGHEGVTCLELIQPEGEDSPVHHFLEKGGGISHLCFQVVDIENAILTAREHGAICINGPVSATAFSGRRIAFLFFRDIGLVEFEEAPDE